MKCIRYFFFSFVSFSLTSRINTRESQNENFGTYKKTNVILLCSAAGTEENQPGLQACTLSGRSDNRFSKLKTL